MARTWMTSALLAAALAWAAPAVSSACSTDKPDEQGPESLLAPLRSEELAAKCTCSGPADCTCKKGQCKCPKCAKRHEGGVVEPLPANTPADAPAGTLI